MSSSASKARRSLPEMGLNITSLLDILTVIVIFLVKSMTLTSESFSVAGDIKLPSSRSEATIEEATVVSLSQKDLRVNQDVILALDKNSRFPANELGSDRRTLTKVKSRLEKERAMKKNLLKAKGVSDAPPGKIIVQADKQLPFDTVKYLLNSVSAVGFTDLQFLTVDEE